MQEYDDRRSSTELHVPSLGGHFLIYLCSSSAAGFKCFRTLSKLVVQRCGAHGLSTSTMWCFQKANLVHD
jgi:hypothetical protein